MMTDREAFQEMADRCSDEAYEVIMTYIQSLLDEIDDLALEIEAIGSAPRKRRRKQEDDWE